MIANKKKIVIVPFLPSLIYVVSSGSWGRGRHGEGGREQFNFGSNKSFRSHETITHHQARRPHPNNIDAFSFLHKKSNSSLNKVPHYLKQENVIETSRLSPKLNCVHRLGSVTLSAKAIAPYFQINHY